MFLILRHEVGETLGALCGAWVLKAGPCHTLAKGRLLDPSCPAAAPLEEGDELGGTLDTHLHTS